MMHRFDRVPRAFNEGPYWGNGSLGVLLYTEGAAFRFAVDHRLLWETRDHTDGEMPLTLAAARQAGQPAFGKSFPKPSFDWKAGPCTTRLPGLTLRLHAGADVTGFEAATDLAAAVTDLSWQTRAGGGGRMRVWLHAEEDVLVIELQDEGARTLRPEPAGWNLDLPALAPLRQWGYVKGSLRRLGEAEHLFQPFGDGQVAVLTTLRSTDLLLCTIEAGARGRAEELAAQGLNRLATAGDDLAGALDRHRRCWQGFWDAFSLSLPDAVLQAAVEGELYKLFCNARSSAAWPMTLQGIWNHDQAMPAWLGDWHNDLNVQVCYWAAFKTNHVSLARPYVEMYSRALPHFAERARRFTGISDAAHVPTTMGPDGRGAGREWSMWNSLLGPELYVAIDFCWYFEHAQDEHLLRTAILPFLSAVARLYLGITEKREDGRRHLPLAQSPEIFDRNGLVLTDDTTFMLSSLRYMLERLAVYCGRLGRQEDARQWTQFAGELTPLPTSEKGFQLWPGHDADDSHRHFSHLFPIFPLGLVSRADPEGDRLIQTSLNTLANAGAHGYCALSFPYRAILSARAGLGDAARLNLYSYLLGLRAPNTFCVNFDAYRTGVICYSPMGAGEPADVFTLEAGLIVPAAVCEMLVHRVGKHLWILPALPRDWKEGEARGLTVEGGHRIDLRFSDYTLEWAVIHPGSSETLDVVIGAPADAYRLNHGGADTDRRGAGPHPVPLDPQHGPVTLTRKKALAE